MYAIESATASISAESINSMTEKGYISSFALTKASNGTDTIFAKVLKIRS